MDIRILPEGEDKYRLEYQDYGRGIPPDVLPQVFDPFMTTGRSKGGTGLGLAITHNIATSLLQGDIACESTQGEGAKFTLVFPRKLKEKAGEG